MANPFLTPSTLPYALPPFQQIEPEHFAPAFDAGMAEHRAEIDAITADPAPATFENTLVPLERSGRLLYRAMKAFYAYASADASPAIEELQSTYAARFTAHADAIRLDPALYARIEAVHADRGSLGDEERHLVERHHTELTLAGAGLDESEKGELRALNERIATLSTSFEQALLADSNDLALHVEDRAALDGLTDGELSAAAAAARSRGLEGYLVSLVLPTDHPHQAVLTDRETRRRLLQAQLSRGRRGGEYDTREILLDLVRTRARRARLLGFESHAAAVTADNTARTPAAVRDLLDRLAPKAAANARDEQQALSDLAGFDVEAHDWSYYAGKVRVAAYDVDLAALRPYFESERVLVDGVFFAATRLFGVTFTERTDLVGYHPDVRVFEVHEEDGTPVGLYLYDLYTRDTKRGGAWMNSLVDQNALLDMPTAVVMNNLNVPKPADGQPTLLTFDEVTTLFHEFGHALHGLLARVTYPKFAGTSVFRDFVEYPSQVNEMWMLWPEVVANYALHHETGEPLPRAVVDRIEAARTFNEGFATSEYLAAALLDLAWHELTPEEADAVTDVEEFERAALAKVGLDNPAVPPRYSSSYFAHVFAGGYASAYYSYIWSELLDADTVEHLERTGGLTRENGDDFRRYVIGPGGSTDLLASYREWRGRDAPVEPLLRRRGLE